jgi:Kef-type K+ transport system membrane component KefB
MTLGTLALLVAAGLVGPLLTRLPRIGPPVVVGEIAAGMVIGASGFGLVDTDDAALTVMADVGLVMLMFVVGTHLPVRDPALRRALRQGLGLAATAGVLAVAVAAVVGPRVGFDDTAVLAVLLASSSGAVALPVLIAMGERRFSTVAIAWIALADVAAVLAVPLVMAQGSALEVIAAALVVVAAATAVYLAARLLGPRRVVAQLREASRDQGWALDLRLSLVVLFALAGLSQQAGDGVLLAGFAVGSVVALLGQPRRVAQQLIGLAEGFFVPLFFVVLGARLDLAALFDAPDAMRLAAVIALSATAVHVVTAALWRLPVAVGMLATAQLGIPAAITSIGLAEGTLSPATAAAVMAGALAALAVASAGAALSGRPALLTVRAKVNGSGAGPATATDTDTEAF